MDPPQTNFQSPSHQMGLSQIIPDSQTIQIPKMDHILAHATHPELSYIYARPELQATAASTAQENITSQKFESRTPKKGRPTKKLMDLVDKKGTKTRKSEIYDKYYLEGNRMKKASVIKKV